MIDPTFDPVARQRLDIMHTLREQTLAACRKIIQTSSKSIRNLHRGELDAAQTLQREAHQMVKDLREAVKDAPMILYAGYIQDAEKEMVEASALLAGVTGQPLPTIADLGVDVTSYLNGLGEASSEARRKVLDLVRHGDFESAEQLLEWMESIYEDLITYDYPDSLTGGLRRTCDALRAVLERTRSDLTLTRSQRELLDALNAQK